jgi:transcriptional regulator GlxA family with amidase domain
MVHPCRESQQAVERGRGDAPSVPPEDELKQADDIPTGWRVANLAGCEIVVGAFSDLKLARHSHDALMLSLIDQGAQRVRYPIVSAGREARAVEQAKGFLRAHLGANVSLRELAEAAVLEPHRLIRAFTAAVGLPPHAWHKQMRIRDAQTRLIEGIASVVT